MKIKIRTALMFAHGLLIIAGGALLGLVVFPLLVILIGGRL